jgi:hypothetical protein
MSDQVFGWLVGPLTAHRRSRFCRLRARKGRAPPRAAPARSVARTTGMTARLGYALALVSLALIVLALAPDASSAEQPRLELGVLTCNFAESEEANKAGDVTSGAGIRRMECGFRPANSGPEEVYRGGIQIMARITTFLQVAQSFGSSKARRQPCALQACCSKPMQLMPQLRQAMHLRSSVRPTVQSYYRPWRTPRRWLIQTRSAGLDQLSHGQACQAQSRSSL